MLIFVGGIVSVRAEEFERDVPPKFSFTETYQDTILQDPEIDDYVVIPRTTLKITAVCSMKGVDLNTIDQDTTVAIDIGGLTGEWTLGEDTRYKKGDTSANIPLLGIDPLTGEDKQIGKVNVVWNAKIVTITLTAADDPDSIQVAVLDRALGEETGSFDDLLAATLSFADRELSARTAYVQGTTAFEEYTSGDISEMLARINVSGEIDSELPSVTMSSPLDGETIYSPTFTLTGTVADNRGPVTIQVSVNDGTEIEATVDQTGGWSLPVEFVRGANTIDVTAADEGGNATTLKTRTINFIPVSNLTLKAEGTGSGQVSGDFFTSFTYIPGASSPEVVTVQEDGAELVVSATPVRTALFERWISNYPLIDETSPRLRFTMQPGMTLTARFVPNVFLPVRGGYSGLLDSSDSAGRGSIALRLAANGLFSGSIRLGETVIRLKGGFGTDGRFVGTVTAGKQVFDLTLELSGADKTIKRITGTLLPQPSTGTSPVSSIVADLSGYNKKTKNAPLELVGGYNVLLTPALANTDEDFPFGIGFGRVTLSKSGKSRFVGKLGDGTALTASAPISEEGVWSLYAPLYASRGSILGRVKFDLQNETSDISGSLTWIRPADRKALVHGEGFSGQVLLNGAKYVKPLPGLRVFLNPDGIGTLSILAPADGSAVQELLLDADVALTSDNKIFSSQPTLALTGGVNVSTGIFTGSFVEPGRTKRLRFSGAVVIGGTASALKGNVAGGYFVRGKRTGAIRLFVPVPELPLDPPLSP